VLPGLQYDLGYHAISSYLSPKQELFCQEMCINGADPVTALQVAYPSTSKKSAQANAYRLLRTNKIQQRIAELKAELQRRYAVEAQNVVQLLSMTMNLDRRSFVDLETGKALALHQLTPEAAAIVDIEYTVDRFGVTHAQPVVAPRLKAAETLCKIMGLADRVEIIDKRHRGSDPANNVTIYIPDNGRDSLEGREGVVTRKEIFGASDIDSF